MSIVLVGSTSGSVTLQEPAVAGTTTINLPATTGTVVLQNASNNLLMNSGYGSDAVAYGCRAWVNFNGTGTVAIRGSGNVTSITDNGTGLYTVNFTTSMPDTNFATNVTAKNPYNSTAGEMIGLTGTVTTSSVQVRNGTISTMYDVDLVCVAVFR